MEVRRRGQVKADIPSKKTGKVARPLTKERLHVSLPIRVVDLLREDVRTGRADHLSDACSRAVQAGLGRRRLKNF